MTSVERINEYVSLEKEPLNTGLMKTDNNWPTDARIEFRNVSFAYDSSLPPTLKNISFEIGKNEKIGVIGRTGAGKSSIFEALFRMAEPGGSILIDGVNISHLSLHNLRSKIAIIPVTLNFKYSLLRNKGK
jgi:ABC-type multidrug transport system fused ATPase/permease subunit